MQTITMDEDLKKTIQTQYAQLPDNVRTAIESTDLRSQIQQIAEKHGLRVDKAGLLEDEITLVLFGLEHPSDFVDNLVAALKLPREKVDEIAKDVNEKVFLSVRQSLMEMHKEQENMLTKENVLKEIEEPAPSSPRAQASPEPEKPNAAPQPAPQQPQAPAPQTEPKNTPPEPVPSMIPPDMPGKAPEKPQTPPEPKEKEPAGAPAPAAPEPAQKPQAPAPQTPPTPSQKPQDSPYSPEMPKKPSESPAPSAPSAPAAEPKPTPAPGAPDAAPAQPKTPATPPTASAGFVGEKLEGTTGVSEKQPTQQNTQKEVKSDPYLEPIE